MRRGLSAANVAWALSVLITCLWVVWGVPEMFHEGWYAPFEWLFFLLPAGLMLALTLVMLRWPRAGAVLFVATGLGLCGLVVWQARPAGGRSAATLASLFSWVPVALFPIVVGLLAYLGRRQKRGPVHYLLAVGLPLLLGLALAVEPAYRISQRLDDGFRGERLIEGNGLTLAWAPAGPGWHRNGGVTWNEVALYGQGTPGFEGKRFGVDGRCNGAGDWRKHCASEADLSAYNVCLYLDQSGRQLMPVRQDIWRMPTTGEVVRSLVRHGANAGCVWDGAVGRSACAVKPDKETPLWDPMARVVYYWTADELDEGAALFVVYNGSVVANAKFVPLGSRGYRCVR